MIWQKIQSLLEAFKPGRKQQSVPQAEARVATRPTAHPKSAARPAPAAAPAEAEPETGDGKTVQITQELRRDIVDFLGADYAEGATITVAEIMKFYSCPEDRARRVIAALIQSGSLTKVGKDTYRVPH